MPQTLDDAKPGEIKSQSSSGLRETSTSKRNLNPSERMSLLSGHQLSAGEGGPEIAAVGPIYLGIQMKRGATLWNLMSVFFLQFFVMVVASDLMALEQPLLMNKNYYNYSSKEATKKQMEENVITGVPGLVFMFLCGYIYDIVGVRYTLSLACFLGGAGLMFYPLGAPYFYILVTGSCLFGLGEDLIGQNTLIVDFVEVKDRGKALSFSFMGVCLGVILSNLVLVHFTRDLDPLLSWSIMAGMMIAFSISMFLTLNEPLDPEKPANQDKPVLTKIKDLSINILKGVKKNPNLLIGWIMNVIIGGPMDVLIMYFFSWLEAWCPDDGSGPFPNQDVMMNYYERQATAGSVISLVLLYFAGSTIDKMNFRVILPITLLMRAGVFYAVYTITDPVQQSTRFWIFCPLIHVTFYISQVAMQSYLYKIYPKHIRGMCITTQHITGYVLGSAYPFLIQYFYEISPRYVMFGVSMIDLGTIVLLLLLFTVGFGKENLQTTEADQIVDDVTANNNQIRERQPSQMQ